MTTRSTVTCSRAPQRGHLWSTQRVLSERRSVILRVWYERPRSMARFGDKNLTSRIIDPADGRIPSLTPSAQQRVDARQQEQREHPADGPENRSLAERCISPTPLGFEPAGGGTSNFLQIVQ